MHDMQTAVLEIIMKGLLFGVSWRIITEVLSPFEGQSNIFDLIICQLPTFCGLFPPYCNYQLPILPLPSGISLIEINEAQTPQLFDIDQAGPSI